MTTITVTITGEGRAIGKTQLARYMHEALRGWSPKGIKRPQVVVVDAEHRTPIDFHAPEGIYETPVGRCVISGPKEDVRHILRLLPDPDDTDQAKNARAERDAAENNAATPTSARLPGAWFDQIVDVGQQIIDNAWERFEKAAVLRPSGKLDANAKHHFAVEIGRAANKGAKVASSLQKTGTYATGGVVGSDESDFTVKVRNGYASLHRVLVEALDQAQAGKGKERHNLGGGIPFERQRMQQISELIGSVDGMTYQACKKITEGVKLPTLKRQERELLGAINYIAGMIIFLRKQAAEKGAADPFDDEPAPNVITVKVDADAIDITGATRVIDTLQKSVDSTPSRAGIPGLE